MRLERLSLEQGNMDGAPAQSDHGEESERKRLTTKVIQVSVDVHMFALSELDNMQTLWYWRFHSENFAASVSSWAHGRHPIRRQLRSHHREVWQQFQHVAAGPAGQTKHLQHQRLRAQHDQHHLQVKHCNTLDVDFAWGKPSNKSNRVHIKQSSVAFYIITTASKLEQLILLQLMIAVKVSHTIPLEWDFGVKWLILWWLDSKRKQNALYQFFVQI